MTTHLENAKYDGLLKEKGGRGFPTLMFLDAEGEIIAKQNERSVAGFEQTLGKVADWRSLVKRQAAGESGLEADLLLAELALGRVGYPEGKERAAKLAQLSPEQKSRLDQLLLDAEVEHLLANLPPRDEEALRAAGRRIEELIGGGRLPSPDKRGSLWSFVLRYAELERKPDLYEKAMAGMKELYGNEPRFQEYFQGLEKKLAEMKAGKDAG